VISTFPDQLFGVISMTPALWSFVFVQLFIAIVAFALCVLPMRTPRAAKWLSRAGTGALFLSVAVSALTYASGLLLSFAAEGPPDVRAAQLATGILTMMHARWMWVPFAIAIGISLKLQELRRRKALFARG
jgi:hypothetical protein